ncbi:D-alanyl-D-alanine carboxypeptidase [Streptomyces sp. SD31]|uniref:D-alanyl-D-alanine carboxypeptidase n=1 Tax=Streptomyces sp. SD31 TaxID=3452208 RepID=UPI003F8C3283
MAGESPDRSKQRESSAEPTSGSAGTVPESRPEADGTRAADTGEKRDPRLAVARESSAPQESAAARRGGVDTATRVLSRRELEAVRAELEKAEGTEDGDAQAGAGPGEAGSPDAGADDAEGTSAEGSRSAEGSDAGSAEGDDAGSAEGGDAGNRDAETDDADAAQDESASAEGSDAGSAEGGDAGDRDAETDDADGAQDEGKGAASGTSSEVPGDGDGDGASVPGDERLRAAVAAWVASSDAADDADARDEADAAEDVKDAEGAAQDGTARDAGDAAAQGAEKAEGADAEAGTGTAAASDDDAPAAAKEAEDGSGEGAPQGPPAPGDEGRTGGAGGPGGKTEADGDAEAGPAVDQPTAVFKAVRPPKPPVDQPTTTLKAPKQPETPAERTSKFVALKPDLPQETPKAPAPAAEATAAIPQVGPERTTQQPLPPKPPLDLLAELTNTPPPPETPVRTIIRRVKIWTPLVLLLVIVLGVVQSVRPLPAPTLDLTAEDTYTFDGSKVDIPWPAEGQAALDVDGLGTFGSSGDQKPVPIASVAKVMTAYLILREHPLESGAEGPDIEIDQAAEDQSDAGQESTVDVTAGDKISQREALESVLIASANNIARRLARWDAGSEKAFVAKMNATAKDLGMTNTTYTDPSGLNNTTVSTAVDQVKLAKAAMKQPAFREVAAMMSYDDYKGKNHPNWNQLVGHNNVVGIKTGTTTSALGNLVFAAKKEVGGETRTIIGAVVRQPDSGDGILAAALDSGDQLIRAAQDALKSATLLKKGDVVGYVDDGLGGRTPVVATKDVTAVGWSGLKVELTFASDAVPHTAKAGTKVGTLTVGDGTSGAVKIPVALQRDLTEPGFMDKLIRLG